MHTNFKIYYFIEKFNLKELSKINKSINIIFRNYKRKDFKNDLIKVRDLCRKRGHSIYLSNNIKLASKLKLNGVYLPSFNKRLIYKNFKLRNKFQIIGSAHSVPEIKIKEMQNCEEIFISPIFKTPKHKNFLDILKFNLLTKETKREIIALGGINAGNLRKISLTKSKGIASISWIKKNGLNKI